MEGTMATVETKRMTAEEFWEWASRPENQDKHYELDQGEVVEMPPPAMPHGVICAWIAHRLWQYVLRQNQGYVCSNDMGLLVHRNPDTVRGPDLMLFNAPRRLEDLSPRYAENVPHLIVEVLSPSDQQGKTNRRIGQYLQRGVPLIWLVDPEVRIVTVYQPGKDFYTREEADELTGEAVLPELRLRVADLFTFAEPAKGA
jgi:Uma2 family endonuclease